MLPLCLLSWFAEDGRVSVASTDSSGQDLLGMMATHREEQQLHRSSDDELDEEAESALMRIARTLQTTADSNKLSVTPADSDESKEPEPSDHDASARRVRMSIVQDMMQKLPSASSASVGSNDNTGTGGRKSQKVMPETETALDNAKIQPGDSRSEGGSQMSRSSAALFHKHLASTSQEEPSLVMLRRLLLVISVLVSAMSIATMEISKGVILDSVHRLQSQDLDGDRTKLLQVCACWNSVLVKLWDAALLGMRVIALQCQCTQLQRAVEMCLVVPDVSETRSCQWR